MSFNNIAGPSNAVAAAFMLPGDVPLGEATFVAVDDRVRSQHAREAVLRHRSSMGSIDDQAMWGVAAPQQHHCHESCGYENADSQLHELEEQFLNFDECAEENIPPFETDADFPQYAIEQTNTSSTNEVPLLGTQTTAVLSLCASHPLHVEPVTGESYSFLPSTSLVTCIPQGLSPSYVWATAACEHAASSTITSTPATISSRGVQKRARADEEEDFEDDAPVSKKTRESEGDAEAAPYSAADEEAISTSGEHMEEEGEELPGELPGFEAEEVETTDNEITQAEEPQEEAVAAPVEAAEAPGTEGEPTPRAKRPRRTNATMLKTTCRLPKSKCPVENCARGTFDPYDHGANKAHLAAHLGATAVIPCLWPDCEETRSSPRLMFKHITEGHIGLPYVCPLFRRGCKWASTKSQWQA